MLVRVPCSLSSIYMKAKMLGLKKRAHTARESRDIPFLMATST